nr:hypothetical protein [Botrimarina hoheduenensis]
MQRIVKAYSGDKEGLDKRVVSRSRLRHPDTNFEVAVIDKDDLARLVKLEMGQEFLGEILCRVLSRPKTIGVGAVLEEQPDSPFFDRHAPSEHSIEMLCFKKDGKVPLSPRPDTTSTPIHLDVGGLRSVCSDGGAAVPAKLPCTGVAPPARPTSDLTYGMPAVLTVVVGVADASTAVVAF